MSKLVSCPDIIARRAKLLEINGFGYEFSATTSKFSICSYKNKSKIQKILPSIIDTLKVSTLELDVYWNKLRIHWSEYRLIESILQMLIEKNVTFTVSGNLRLRCDPVELVNECHEFKFSQQVCELLKIKEFKEILQCFRSNGNRSWDCKNNNFLLPMDYGPGAKVLCDPWNWSSLEGQQFCLTMLRPFYSLPRLSQFEAINHPENYWHWEIFQNCDLSTLRDLYNNQVKTQDAQVEDMSNLF